MPGLTTKVPAKKARRIILHTTVLAVAIITSIVLVENHLLHQALEFASGFGLVFAAFLSGMLFTSIFTTPIAIASLALLGQDHSPLLVSLIAATGSMTGDALLLKIVRQDILEDVKVFTTPFTTPKIRRLFRTKLLYYPLTAIAAIVLASPLPDELAIALFGAIKFQTRYFYVLSFVFNFLGILVITGASAIFFGA